MTVDRKLEFENTQVLFLVQALLGLITTNFRAVAIRCSHEQVRLNFLISCESNESREDIEDIVFEFEALQSRNIDVFVDVTADRNMPIEEFLSPDDRLVFHCKE